LGRVLSIAANTVAGYPQQTVFVKLNPIRFLDCP